MPIENYNLMLYTMTISAQRATKNAWNLFHCKFYLNASERQYSKHY